MNAKSKLLVSNVHSYLTEDSISQIFEAASTRPECVQIIGQQEDGGFIAQVTYPTLHQAGAALKALNQQSIFDKIWTIDYESEEIMRFTESLPALTNNFDENCLRLEISKLEMQIKHSQKRHDQQIRDLQMQHSLEVEKLKRELESERLKLGLSDKKLEEAQLECERERHISSESRRVSTENAKIYSQKVRKLEDVIQTMKKERPANINSATNSSYFSQLLIPAMIANQRNGNYSSPSNGRNEMVEMVDRKQHQGGNNGKQIEGLEELNQERTAITGTTGEKCEKHKRGTIFCNPS